MSRRLCSRVLPVLLVGLAAAFAASGGPARAAAAVTCADAGSDQALLQGAIDGGGAIQINGHCLGNWTVSTDVTLTGAPGAVLDGNGSSSVLTVASLVTLTVDALKIENGSASAGGGVFVGSDSTVNVDNSTIVGNVASGIGGGLYAEDFAFLAVNGSSISGNQSAGAGGGIAVVDAFLSVTNSTVTGNGAVQGGGIGSQSSDVTLTNTHVSANSASGFGGGILSFDSGAIDQQTVLPTASSNRHFPFAPGPFLARRSAMPALGRPLPPVPTGFTVLGSSVDHNTAIGQGGGGIVNVGTQYGSLLTLTNSSVSFNNAPALDATGAGGIANVAGSPQATATLNVSGSRLAGNLSRHGNGGAIYNVSQGGSTLLSIASSSVSSGPPFLNPNQAALGGGIYEDATLGPASMVLAAGAAIAHNKAWTDGGGVYDLCGGGLTRAPGSVVFLNSPNNVVNAACPV